MTTASEPSTDHFLPRIVELIQQAGDRNEDALTKTSERFAETIADGGLVHLFGSGHSVLPCQEAFPRYGSFIGFNPLLDPRLMWHDVLGTGGTRELLWLERTEGYIDKFLSHEPLNQGDCLVVVSHSGRNAAGVEAAMYGKQREMFVVAVTSSAMLDQKASHSSGKRIADVADVAIDTAAPVEDAIVPVEGWKAPVSGSSTVLAMILIHELIARTAAALAERGVEMPTFASPTIPGVDLGDTDRIYADHRERIVTAEQNHLATFRRSMGG